MIYWHGKSVIKHGAAGPVRKQAERFFQYLLLGKH